MPQLMIEGQIDTRDDTIRALREENGDLRRTAVQAEQAIQELRVQLLPLYNALRLVFGVIEELRPVGGNASPLDSRTKAIWDDWKRRLGGALAAKFIDALALHGGMTQTQLRIAVGCASRSVTNVIYQLNKAGLISKREGKIFLKEL